MFQITGKRIRKSFSTLKVAEKFAAAQRALYHRKGLAAFVRTAADRVIAERCMAKLAPFKVGLEGAARLRLRQNVGRHHDLPLFCFLTFGCLRIVATT